MAVTFRRFSQMLAAIEPNLQKELAGELKDVAETVAVRVRARMPSRTGRARSSVKSGANRTGAYVQEGRKAVPYVPWLDFGGVLKPVGGRHNTIRRDRVKGGRYLYPEINRQQDEVERGAQDAVQSALRKAGWS